MKRRSEIIVEKCKLFGCSSITLIFVWVGTSHADCFDERLVLSKSELVTNGARYQDVFLYDFSSTPALETRLSAGALASNPFDNYSVAASENGADLVFVSTKSIQTDIYKMRAVDADGDGQGDNLQQITNDVSDYNSLQWSAGGMLTYLSDKNSTSGEMQVYKAELPISNSSLQNAEMLTDSDKGKRAVRISNDQSTIIFAEEITPHPNRTFELQSYHIANQTSYFLSADSPLEMDGDFTVDDQYFYYASGLNDPQGTDIYRKSIDLMTEPPITDDPVQITASPGFQEMELKISRSGRCLGYLGIQQDGAIDLYVRELSNGFTKKVTTTGNITSFDWMP